MNALKLEHLRIDTATVGDVVEVRWTGELAVRNPREVVGTYLDLLRTTLRKQKVCFDFCEFEYMNSASVTLVMEFLRSATEVSQYVTVRYRTKLQWQKTLFGAMRVIARNWNNIDIQGVDD